MWNNCHIIQILVRAKNSDFYRCFKSISSLNSAEHGDRIEQVFYEITQYEIEFVTNVDQSQTNCQKLSIVLHGHERSTNLIHLDESFSILPSTAKSHRYVIECSSIGYVENIQLYIVNLSHDWYLEEIIIHKLIYLVSGRVLKLETTPLKILLFDENYDFWTKFIFLSKNYKIHILRW